MLLTMAPFIFIGFAFLSLLMASLHLAIERGPGGFPLWVVRGLRIIIANVGLRYLFILALLSFVIGLLSLNTAFILMGIPQLMGVILLGIFLTLFLTGRDVSFSKSLFLLTWTILISTLLFVEPYQSRILDLLDKITKVKVGGLVVQLEEGFRRLEIEIGREIKKTQLREFLRKTPEGIIKALPKIIASDLDLIKGIEQDSHEKEGLIKAFREKYEKVQFVYDEKIIEAWNGEEFERKLRAREIAPQEWEEALDKRIELLISEKKDFESPYSYILLSTLYVSRGHDDAAVAILLAGRDKSRGSESKLIPDKIKPLWELNINLFLAYVLGAIHDEPVLRLPYHQAGLKNAEDLLSILSELSLPDGTEKTLTTRFKNAVAIFKNNIAYIMAIRKENEMRAREYIKEAIDYKKTNSLYLDTYGMVNLMFAAEHLRRDPRMPREKRLAKRTEMEVAILYFEEALYWGEKELSEGELSEEELNLYHQHLKLAREALARW